MATEVIQKWYFDKPTLQSGGEGSYEWTRDAAKAQKGSTGWQAKLTGGAQSGGNNWAATYVPANEVLVPSFKTAQWTYYLTNAEEYGFNIVIWVHDPTDLNRRAEITQSASATGLSKDQYWNAHELDTTVNQFFWFGEDYSEGDHVLDGSDISSGTGTLSSWDDYRSDPLFEHWTIYRISIEYGYYSTGTFEAGWLTELKLNGKVVLLKPDAETQLFVPALRTATGTGEKVSESGKLYYVVWAGAGGGPEPRIQLADDNSTFFDMYSELKVCVVLSPAVPIPFVGKLTITSDARTVSIGYTIDSEG